MLPEALSVRRDVGRAAQAPGRALLTYAVGLLVGIMVAAVTSAGGSSPAPATAAGEPSSAAAASTVGSTAAPARGIETAVARAVHEADASGQAALAVWVGGTSSPIIRTAPSPLQPLRLWSISKAVVVLSLLRAGASPGELGAALDDALLMSDNCAARVLADRLAKRTGNATTAFQATLTVAGVHLATPMTTGGATEDCSHYPGAAAEQPDAPRFGVAEWTPRNAIAFAHALADQRFGPAGAELLQLLRRPKEKNPRAAASAMVNDARWGAGTALRSWRPEYKAGWGAPRGSGGQAIGRFWASQAIVLPGRTTRGAVEPVAIFVAYSPDVRPAQDDPTVNGTPQAVERMLTRVERALRRGGIEPA